MKKIFKKIIDQELAYFAKMTYLKFRPYVVGITGSSGKTTIKYMTGELLKSVKDKVAVAGKNLNTETGLPLSVLGYQRPPEAFYHWIFVFLAVPIRYLFTFKYPKYLVLEYAADKPDDMRYLANIIPPDISIISNFGVAHIEAFKTTEKIITEKWVLAQKTKDKVICDETTLGKTSGLEKPYAQVVLSGQAKTVKAQNIKYLTSKTEFNLGVFGKSYPTSFKFWGKHNVENLEKSVIAVEAISGDIGKIIKKIPELSPQTGRGERKMGLKDVLIIDESYNANPLSMIAALGNLEQAVPARDKNSNTRKVAILGEMREIGPISQKSHQEVVKYAKRVADKVYGVGGGFRGLDLDKWYKNVEELSKDLDQIIRKGDIVLVKGSLKVNLKKIVERLT